MSGKTILSYLALFSCLANCGANKSLILLDPILYRSIVEIEDVLVVFRVPSCEACGIVFDGINDFGTGLKIGTVNCGKYEKFCTEQNVTKYPSLVLFRKGGLQSKTFEGPLNIFALRTFLGLDKMEPRSELICTPGSVLHLTADSYSSTTGRGTFFIKFYSPTCPYCIKLAETWIYLAREMAYNKTLCIAEYDCKSGQSICAAENVVTVPTLLWIEKGMLKKKYEGSRDVDSLRSFAEKMLLGTYVISAQSANTVNKLQLLFGIIAAFVKCK